SKLTSTLNGAIRWSGVPALPARRNEALPQGRALLHGEVRHREAQLSAGTARQDAQGQDGGLWRAAAREAESQTHLRSAGRSVPPLLRVGGAPSRHHGRDAAPSPRAPA